MPEHEAQGRAVYDHDNEEPRPAGRRRRQVADWGVGEEIFDHMPGRRFERRQHREVPRGDAADGRRTIVIETGDDELQRELPPAAGEEFTSRDEALRAREADDELWGGDEPFAEARRERARGRGPPGRRRRVRQPRPASRLDEPEPAELDAPRTEAIVRGGVEGRRTVKIGGRPAEFHGTSPGAQRAARRAPCTSASARGRSASRCGRSRSGCC